MKHLLILSLISLITYSNVLAQKFDREGRMKITEVASDKKYGYEPKRKHAIKVGSIKNEYAFIYALAGPKGEKIRAVRKGSCCNFRSSKAASGRGLLDKWEITWQGQHSPLIIYLNAYEYKQPMCPAGLSIFSNISDVAVSGVKY